MKLESTPPVESTGGVDSTTTTYFEERNHVL
jgi:hypothetical protein